MTENIDKIIGNVRDSEMNRLMTHIILRKAKDVLPLNVQEHGLMNSFLERLTKLFGVYIRKDRQYSHAWRNMPWQSCIIRSREKLQRLLTLKDITDDDIFEEGGDSIMYLLFAMHQFENGSNLEPTSKKALMIQNHLEAIEMILNTDDDKVLFQIQNAPLTTWIDYDKDAMTIDVMLHELNAGANIKIGDRFIVGHKDNPHTAFLIVDGEGKVFGMFDPYKNLKVNEDGIDVR